MARSREELIRIAIKAGHGKSEIIQVMKALPEEIEKQFKKLIADGIEPKRPHGLHKPSNLFGRSCSKRIDMS